MAKLHELLAVEGDLEGAFKKILAESAAAFTKKVSELFYGAIRTLRLFDDEAQVTEPEHKHMTTTVKKRLDYQQEHVIRYLDAVLQKEATNQEAKADLVVDGVTIMAGLPATFLLGLESKLKKLREVYEAIPTLQAGVKWELDPNRGDDVYRTAHPDETFKTKKTMKPVVLYEATKQHPAQVKEVPEDVNVGKYTTEKWTGVLSPADKSALIGRLDKLIRAAKKARQRANTTEVVEISVGKEIFDFLNAA